MSNAMTLWQPDNRSLVPSSARTPKAITKHATQLSDRDRRQGVFAFKAEHHEMGLNFIWLRTIAALKRELATVGFGLLGEMLGRVEVGENDNVEDLLTIRDTIRLAEELGIVTNSEALRLRHIHEIIAHSNQLAIDEEDSEEIDGSEAIAYLKVCVKAVLAKPRVEVAKKFVEFREALESESFVSDEDKIRTLLSSPYFFWKLTIDILMNSARNSTGAKLEHCLANINILIPELWENLREKEKWHIGRTYAELYSEGKKTSMSGLKQALMKVQGFDFVPENLRSDTFVKAAEAILRAHDGMNNFYNEPSPTRSLAQLGTSIPIPALPTCMTALLSVVLGSQYGISWSAQPIAEDVLNKLGRDRWRYYLDQVLPTDSRILGKLMDDKPCRQWIEIVERYSLSDLQLKEREVSRLIDVSVSKREVDIKKSARKLISQYYGKRRNR